MSTFSRDMCLYLQSLGIGTLGTDLNYGKYTPEEGNIVYVFERQGLATIESVQREVSLVIDVQNTSYNTGNTKAETVHAAVRDKVDIFDGVSGTTHTAMVCNTRETPEYMGQDARGHHHWLVSCYILGK